MYKCYQCMRDTMYLFDDARCNECTRLTEQDICGGYTPDEDYEGENDDEEDM